MRRTQRTGNFFLCLLINLLINPEGLVPAAILFALHFILDLSLWWAALALALWVLWHLLWTLALSWVSRAGNIPDLPKENKNPYSAVKRK